jgi:hypothetical protein
MPEAGGVGERVEDLPQMEDHALAGSGPWRLTAAAGRCVQELHDVIEGAVVAAAEIVDGDVCGDCSSAVACTSRRNV